MPTVLYSASAAVRVDAARRFVESVPPAGECLVIGEDRAAADDFVRGLSTREGARFGLRRCSLRQLAAELAATELARRGCVPAAGLNVEAVAARVAFEEREAGTLGRLAAVSRVPSFARTLASTLDELRHARSRWTPASARPPPTLRCWPGATTTSLPRRGSSTGPGCCGRPRRPRQAGNRCRPVRSCCSTSRFPTTPRAHWWKRWRRARRGCSPPCRRVTGARLRRWRNCQASAWSVRRSGRPRRPGAGAPLSVHGRRAATAAGRARRRQRCRVLLRARGGTRVRGDRPRHSEGIGRRRPTGPDGDPGARPARVCGAARDRAEPRRYAGLVCARHAHTRSQRPRAAGAAGVRRRAAVGAAVCGVPFHRPRRRRSAPTAPRPRTLTPGAIPRRPRSCSRRRHCRTRRRRTARIGSR